MKSLIKRKGIQWNIITQAGLWIMGIVAGFVLPPKLGVPEEESSIWKLAQFIVNILIGLILVLSISYKHRSHLRYWFGSTLIALLFAVGAYFFYMQKSSRGICTCNYYSTVVVIGTELRDSENHKDTPCTILVEQATGAVDEVWTAESITQCRLILGISYVITVPLFAIGLMSMLQTLYIANEQNRIKVTS